MNLESANLILRTSSVAVGTDKNTARTLITFKNINMQVVLGSLYSKYQRFKICFTSFGNINTSTIPNVSDRVLMVGMRGLNWTNRLYDGTSSSFENSVVLGTTFFNNSTGFSLNFTGEIGWVFEKPPSNNVDLTIFLNRVSDGTIPTAGNYGESVFCFSIYGIEE